MDTLTHALSGALLARLIAARAEAASALPSGGPTSGRVTAPWDGCPGAPAVWQSVLVGAVAGAFPDIDFVAHAFGDIAYLTQHRGLTHSVPMLPLWAVGLAWLLAKCFALTRAQAGGWKSLYAVAAAGIAIHIAGDWITQFGTMLLQPFSNQRFGLGAMFIIDLGFSGLLLAGLLLAALLPRRRWPAGLGLAAAAAWVGVAWGGQQEAIAVAERHAAAQDIEVQEIVVMPRPASPYNWTIAVFDGASYHVAHVNTRRTQPLDAAAPGPRPFDFLRAYSAPYQPERLAAWTVVPRFGDASAPDWVGQAWRHEAFGFFRWFAQTPALLLAQEARDARGRLERCAWFRDLRFEFPGREIGPFRYGLCLPPAETPGAPARVFRLDGAQRLPV
jgi:inner membrane protein